MFESRIADLGSPARTTGPNGTLRENPVSDIFGTRVFGLAAMKEYLTDRAYKAVVEAIRFSQNISFEVSENVAKGMKKWAMDNGATHFTHWFQPLTGLSAEKHDAFYKPSFNLELQGIESLSGQQLIQQEPDASSFPSGGLRSTDEARGYTVWDPSSFAFIQEITTGRVLCIPSVFISYTGESLDYKAPLLKSIGAINQAVGKTLELLGDPGRSVVPTLGWEQEYFVIDQSLARKRPDILLSGRALFGRMSAKGQEKNEFYFGSIPERVQQFMNDFEKRSLEMGIPLSSRHNEVAPHQYECAPMFEEVNSAIDHNVLLMNVMRDTARQHGLEVLFHEKPFRGVNGSGKHSNWSLATARDGENLLDPGKEPHKNLRFLTVFINVICAVNKHAHLLRAGIASSGNDHRLGQHEAPPAIISVFTGQQLGKVLDHFKTKGLKGTPDLPTPELEKDIPRIPTFLLDNTDRNRTSPFPFTGNKFEFRAVGASHNPSFVLTVLQTCVAEQFTQFNAKVEALIEKKTKPEEAVVKVLQEELKANERIIFNGDGYSHEWEEEAARRGLPNIKGTPNAAEQLLDPAAIEMFVRHKIFTPDEVKARVTIILENYIADMACENKLVEELAYSHILPAATDHQLKLVELYEGYAEMGLDKPAKRVKEEAERVAKLAERIYSQLEKLAKVREKADKLTEVADIARVYYDQSLPTTLEIREAADELELVVDDQLWRLPKYRELLLVRS
ncbi:MAG: glutamine synthetase III [Bacteroidia bacterium]|nr:glutamine synthetase III [Bacteroidia bacterium]